MGSGMTLHECQVCKGHRHVKYSGILPMNLEKHLVILGKD